MKLLKEPAKKLKIEKLKILLKKFASRKFLRNSEVMINKIWQFYNLYVPKTKSLSRSFKGYPGKVR